MEITLKYLGYSLCSEFIEDFEQERKKRLDKLLNSWASIKDI